MNNFYNPIIPIKDTGDTLTAAEQNLLTEFLSYRVGNFDFLIDGVYYPDNDSSLYSANGCLYDYAAFRAFVPPGWFMPDASVWSNFGSNYFDMSTQLELSLNGFTRQNGSFITDSNVDWYFSSEYRAMNYNYPFDFYDTVKSYNSMPNYLNSAFYVRYYKPDDGSADTETTINWLGDEYRIKKLEDGNIWFLENLKYIPDGLGYVKRLLFAGPNIVQSFVDPRPFSVPSVSGVLSNDKLIRSNILELNSTQIRNSGSSKYSFAGGDPLGRARIPIGLYIDYAHGSQSFNNVSIDIYARTQFQASISTGLNMASLTSSRKIFRPLTSLLGDYVSTNSFWYGSGGGANATQGDGSMRLQLLYMLVD